MSSVNLEEHCQECFLVFFLRDTILGLNYKCLTGSLHCKQEMLSSKDRGNYLADRVYQKTT